MATAYVVDIPSVTEEEYEKVTGKVNEAGRPQVACFMRVARSKAASG